MTLNPKMTYFRQQETSLVSRILLRLLCPGWFGSREGILLLSQCSLLVLLHIISTSFIGLKHQTHQDLARSTIISLFLSRYCSV